MGITQQIGASSLIKPGVIDNTAARPASPYEGQVIFQKDTDQLLVWNGSSWVIPNTVAQTTAFGSWQSWSPTITSDGGTLSSTSVLTARYSQINKTVICALDVRVTGVGSAAGGLVFTLPVTQTSNFPPDGCMGNWREYNTTGETGVVCKSGTDGTKGASRRYDNGAILNTGRYFGATFTYEAA